MASESVSDVSRRRQWNFDDVIRCTLVIASISCLLVFETGDAIDYLGSEAIWRENEDLVKKAIFIVDPTDHVRSNGTLVGWNVYTTRGRRSQVVFLQVWRPISLSRRQFLRVGETRIAALWVGHSAFLLFPVDRIPVRTGDVIGIMFPNYNPIPFTVIPCEGDGREHLFKYNPHRAQNVGSEVTFEIGSSDSNPCRKYSINATIMSDDEVKMFDFDYEETTDGRFDRRPYGHNALSKRPLIVCCRTTSLWRQTPLLQLATITILPLLLHLLCLRT